MKNKMYISNVAKTYQNVVQLKKVNKKVQL